MVLVLLMGWFLKQTFWSWKHWEAQSPEAFQINLESTFHEHTYCTPYINGCLVLGVRLELKTPKHVLWGHQVLSPTGWMGAATAHLMGNVGKNVGLLSSWVLQVGKGAPAARMGMYSSYSSSIQSTNRVTHHVTTDVPLLSSATGYIKLTEWELYYKEMQLPVCVRLDQVSPCCKSEPL